MLNTQGKIKFSEYAFLYDMLVPADNKYRLIDELIDFSFIYDELKGKYCLDNGRKAADPVMLFKYLMIKAIDNLSDVDVVEHSRYDLSYKRFLGLMPEDNVIDPSLLTKFRRQRLKDVNLLDMLIGKTVGVAIEKGILKSKTIIVDATHTISRANPMFPIDVLRSRSKVLRNRIKEWDNNYEDKLPLANHDNNLKNELVASEALIEFVLSDAMLSNNPALQESINYLTEAVEDVHCHHAISHDREARTGHKSAETSFFGYKTHLAMSSERIITAAIVTTGEKTDGQQLPDLVYKTENAGMEIDTIIGDAAYSGKDNIVLAKDKNITLAAKVIDLIANGHVVEKSQLDDQFTYNKDADRYVCPVGILSTKGIKRKKRPNDSVIIGYEWRVDKCSICKLKEECIGSKKAKGIYVRLVSNEHREQIDFQKTDQFRKLSRERYKIEAKNSELKNIHGYGRAESYGLSALELQGAVTIFAVNLKRIIKLMAK